MSEDRSLIIETAVDSTGARAGFNEIAREAGAMAQSVARASTPTTEAVEGIGRGANRSASQLEAAQRAMVGSIQRTTVALDAGGRSTAAYFELLSRQRGFDPAVVAPYIAQLREVEQAQARQVRASAEADTARLRAAEVARTQAAAERELAQAQAGREQFLNSLREQIRLYGRSADDVLRYRAAQAGLAAEAAPLILQLQNLRAAHEQVAQAAREQAASERAAAQVQAGQNSFIASLEQQASAIGRTRVELLELQAAQLGVSSQAAPFIARLREAEGSLVRTGVSAGQTAAALRGVPAQFTDILTSLQGGQAPLTVLFQQGGQLRDMFGSAGGAARALGGYILGLVNPFTVAAAAAVALGVAYHQGSKEAEEYGRQLILSGNAAGTTSGQLTDMARKISATIGTQGNAAEALAAMVGTGKVAADNLEQFSAVAIKAQRALGQSVEDTAKEFADLAKTPLASLEKLNEKYHFLTGTTYAQVKALQDQGRAIEAAQLAQKTYAEAFDGVTTKVDANLGTMQRGWRGVTDFAKGAWDAMLGIGRAESLEQKLADVQRRLANAPSARLPNGLTTGSADRSAAYDAQRAKDLAEEASLKNQIALQNTKSALQADQQRFNAADLEWSKLKTQNLTRAKQLELDLAQTRQKGLDAGASDVEINTELAKVRLKYNDIYNDGIDSQIAGLKRRQAVEDIIAKRALDQISARRAAGSITEDDAINESASRELEDMAAKRVAMEGELALIRQKQNSQAAQADKQGEIAALDEAIISRRIQLTNDLFALEQSRTRQALENYARVRESASAERDGLIRQVQAQRDYNEQIGMTATEVLNLSVARIEEQAARKDTEADIAEGLDMSGELAESYRQQAKALRDLAAAQQAGFVKQRDPWVGLTSSVRRYGEEAANTGALIGSAMDNALRSTEDAFVSLVTTGKASFKDLANSILADLARIQVKKAIAGFVDMAVGGVGSLFGPGTIGSGLGGARASGGPVSGGVPYLVGERGPEIFTPSSSGQIIPNHAIGGGIQINTNVSVSSGGATSQTSGDSNSTGRALAGMVNAAVKDVLVRESRQGGLLWNQRMGRA